MKEKLIIKVDKSEIAYELPDNSKELKKVLSAIFKKHHVNLKVLVKTPEEVKL